MANMSKLSFTLSELTYLCYDKLFLCEIGTLKSLKDNFYEMIVMGII